MDTVKFDTFFDEDGSGVFSFQRDFFLNSDAFPTDAQFCDTAVSPDINWSTIDQGPLRKIEGQTVGSCTLIYEFDNLEELSALQQTLEVSFNQLTISNGLFTYKTSKQICSNVNDDTVVNWSVTPPGTIRSESRNVSSVTADTVSWILNSNSCGEMVVLSRLTVEEPPAPSPLPEDFQDPTPVPSLPPPAPTPEPPLPVDIVNGWTTVVLSLTTIIATVITTALALAEYKKRKNK